MPLMTTQQAAQRLGVTVRHVQRLVSAGEIAAIGTDRIDAESVVQWLAHRAGSRVRAWEEATAWAAVHLLEGGSAPWLGQSQRSRLRAALAAAGATELAARTRNRAEVLRFHAHPMAMGRLAREVVPSGAGSGIGGLTAVADRVDGYVTAAGLDRLVRRYRLESDPSGAVVLRATDMPLDVVTELARGPRHVLAGLDLAGSTDARERAAGSRILDRALGRMGG